MFKKNKKKSIITSSIITIMIVAMLILSGPAGAVIVSIVGLDGSSITQGNSKTFNVTITMESPDKFVPISNISLNISGNTPKQCSFYTSGSNITCDPGISIVPVSVPGASNYGNGSGYGVDTNGSGAGYDFTLGYGWKGSGYGYGNGSGYGYGGYGYGSGGGSVSFTYQITLSTSGMTAGSYTARAYLNTGNTALDYFASSVARFTIAAPASTGGGGGGSSSGGSGGGGVVTAEPYDNIAGSETYEMNLVYNIPVIYIFKLPEHGIYEISATGNENVNNVAIRVEALKGPTKITGISAPPGTVYKNLNIWAGSKRIKEGVIRFKVENTWIADNKIASSDLLMVMWNGKEWAKLETSELKKDGTYTFYEAKTESLSSSFAITALKGGVVPTATPAAGTPVKPAGTGTGTATPVPTKTQTPGFEAIIAVFAIAMLATLLKNNKNRR